MLHKIHPVLGKSFNLGKFFDQDPVLIGNISFNITHFQFPNHRNIILYKMNSQSLKKNLRDNLRIFLIQDGLIFRDIILRISHFKFPTRLKINLYKIKKFTQLEGNQLT